MRPSRSSTVLALLVLIGVVVLTTLLTAPRAVVHQPSAVRAGTVSLPQPPSVPGDDEDTTAAPSPAAVVMTPHGVAVPILLYHYIRINPNPQDRLGFNLSVTPADFAAQMSLLQMAGAHPITLAELTAALTSGAPLPAHPVVLTFDDGHADFATVAAPILHHLGFAATSFVVTGTLGHAGAMSAGQVRAVASAGMVIGAHTVHHLDLRHVSPALCSAEITQSKQDLERLLGIPVTDFAYPYGGISPVALSDVRAAGFSDAVSTLSGALQTADLRWTLHRQHITGGMSLATFAGVAGLPVPTSAQAARAAAAGATLVAELAQLVQAIPGLTPSPSSAPVRT